MVKKQSFVIKFCFIVHLKTGDIYKDIAEYLIEARFDTSNFELDTSL